MLGGGVARCARSACAYVEFESGLGPLGTPRPPSMGRDSIARQAAPNKGPSRSPDAGAQHRISLKTQKGITHGWILLFGGVELCLQMKSWGRERHRGCDESRGCLESVVRAYVPELENLDYLSPATASELLHEKGRVVSHE